MLTSLTCFSSGLLAELLFATEEGGVKSGKGQGITSGRKDNDKTGGEEELRGVEGRLRLIRGKSETKMI